MGLYIRAYSNLQYIGEHEFDPEMNEGEPGPFCYYENHVQAKTEVAYPLAFRGIPLTGKVRGFLWGGCYAITPGTVTHSFQAGSYAGYATWCSNLASHFNPDLSPDKPFYGLINFSDCEGVISSRAALELLGDFNTYAELYAASGLESECIGTTRYADWTRAFYLAANNGLVDFR